MLAPMAGVPARIVWTDHARVKAHVLGIALTDVESWIAQRHGRRERNHGAADWRVAVGSVVVVYNHPDGDDARVARVVTVWRRR